MTTEPQSNWLEWDQERVLVLSLQKYRKKARCILEQVRMVCTVDLPHFRILLVVATCVPLWKASETNRSRKQ